MTTPQDIQTEFNQIFQIRIVGEGVKPASQFLINPNNPRRHPPKQRAANLGSLQTLGWIARVTENVVTGYLVDGEDRVWHALQNGDQPVPFQQVALSPDEENLAVAIFDQTGEGAEIDHGRMGDLIEMIEKPENPAVIEILNELAMKSKPHEPIMTDEMDGDAFLIFGDAADVERVCWERGWEFKHVGSVKVVPMESSKANAKKK